MSNPSATTVCGRPGVTDIGRFARFSAGKSPLITGDINYGFVISSAKDLPPGTPVPPGGVATSIPSGWFVGPESTGPNGCNVYGSPVECPIGNPKMSSEGCVYPYFPQGCILDYTQSSKPQFYPGSWPQYTDPQAQVLCCTDMANSGECAPDQCSASPGVCQASMKSLCLATTSPGVNGINGNWATPSGLSGGCDQYAALTAGVTSPSPSTNANASPPSSVCPNGNSCGEDFVYSAVSNYFSQGGSPTDDTLFASKIPGLCSLYPGLCDPLLKQQCSTLSSGDLNPRLWSGRTYDSTGVLPVQICGCFIPPEVDTSTVPMECQSSCSFPGTIPIGAPGGGALECTATECVIDGLTVNYINTTGGAVGITQVCGQCNAANPCACYFSGISISGVNDPIGISTNCQACYSYDPSTGTATPIPGGCPALAGGSGPGIFSGKAGSIFKNFLIVLFLFLFGYFLYKFFVRCCF